MQLFWEENILKQHEDDSAIKTSPGQISRKYQSKFGYKNITDFEHPVECN